MRIQNTAHERKPTRHLYNADIMADDYEPPGIEFSADGVARVKQHVGEALVAEYEHFEPVEDETDEAEAADDGEATDDPEDTN